MQTDIDTLSEETIRSIVKKKPLSEDQARTLIDKEKMGRGRKRVMEFLALQARKARIDLNLRHAHIAGIHLPEVSILSLIMRLLLFLLHPVILVHFH